MHDKRSSTEKEKKDTASDKFMMQIKEAVKIAEVKYPKDDGSRVVWIFDHSS